MEGRMVGKPTRGRRLQMLEDLYENNSYEVLKKTEMRGEIALERKCKNLLYSRQPKKKLLNYEA